MHAYSPSAGLLPSTQVLHRSLPAAPQWYHPTFNATIGHFENHMPPSTTIQSIHFTNFKALRSYAVPLRKLNYLVGSNNSGKSTVISAIRILVPCLRRASSRTPSLMEIGGKRIYAHHISQNDLPITLDYITHNQSDDAARVEFHLTNRTKLVIEFPGRSPDACQFYAYTSEHGVINYLKTITEYKKFANLEIGVVPHLGPIETNEELLSRQHVERSLSTHLAPRHFRNYWHHFPKHFEDFRDKIEKTWAGMSVDRPTFDGARLVLPCTENGVIRELGSVGFGFQIWSQLLTHLSNANGRASVVVLDEPEIYLHPEVQRRLVDLLKEMNCQVIAATHSTEIISSVETSDLVVINKEYKSAHRLKNSEEVQGIFEALGSAHNLAFTNLTRNPRVLFVEGKEDFEMISHFAKISKLHELERKEGINLVPISGFSGSERIPSMIEGLQRVLGTKLISGVLLDRDYYDESEIDELRQRLGGCVQLVHIHKRKEFENYYLSPPAIAKALRKKQSEAHQNDPSKPPIPLDPDLEKVIENLIMEITGKMYNDIAGKWVARGVESAKQRDKSVDNSTLTTDALKRLSAIWATLEGRLTVVPGKEVLGLLRGRLKELKGVTVTNTNIRDGFREEDIPEDLKEFLFNLEKLRTSRPIPSSHADY